MKIAYVCADAGIEVLGGSGAARHIQELMRALIDLGARIELFAASVGQAPAPALRSIVVRRLEGRGDGGDVDPELRRVLVECGPFDAVYERHSLWSAAAMEYAWNRRIPGVLEINAPLVEEHRRFRGRFDVRLAERQRRRAFRAASCLLPVSRPLAAWIRRVYPWTGRIEIIPNGVDVERFRPPSSAVASSSGMVIGYCGSLKPWHDPATLIRAFGKISRRRPDLRLELVGEGPCLASLKALAQKERAASRIVFRSPVAFEDVPRIIGRFDIAVSPFRMVRPFYFCPLKVYEYMAAGRPVVAPSLGDLPALLEWGRAGMLYRPESVRDLARTLVRLIENPTLRHSLGEEAARAVRAHTWRHRAASVLSLVQAGSLVREEAVDWAEVEACSEGARGAPSLTSSGASNGRAMLDKI